MPSLLDKDFGRQSYNAGSSRSKYDAEHVFDKQRRVDKGRVDKVDKRSTPKLETRVSPSTVLENDVADLVQFVRGIGCKVNSMATRQMELDRFIGRQKRRRNSHNPRPKASNKNADGQKSSSQTSNEAVIGAGNVKNPEALQLLNSML